MSYPSLTVAPILNSATSNFERFLFLQKLCRPAEAIFKTPIELIQLKNNERPASVLRDFLTAEERQSIVFRMKEMQELEKGHDRHLAYAEGAQLSILQQLEKLCEGITCIQAHVMRVIKTKIISSLIHCSSSPSIKNLGVIRDNATILSLDSALKQNAVGTVEEELLDIIDEVITCFFEFENYLRKGEEVRFTQAIASQKIATKKLRALKQSFSLSSDLILLENLDKSLSLLLLIESCFNDRKNLLPLILKPLILPVLHEEDFLSAKGWIVLKSSMENCLFGTRAIQRKAEQLIRALKKLFKDHGRLTAVNKDYLAALEEAFGQYKILENFLQDEMHNHPAFRQAFSMVQEGQFDLMQMQRFYSLCKSLEDKFREIKNRIMPPILKKIQEAADYFSQESVSRKLEAHQAKYSHRSPLSEKEYGEMAVEYLKIKEALDSLPNSYGRDLQFDMGVFFTQYVASSVSYLEHGLEQYQLFHQFNSEGVDPSLLKSQFICESDLFCIRIHHYLVDLLDDSQLSEEEKKSLEEISSYLRHATALLQTIKDSINFSQAALTPDMEILITIKSIMEGVDQALNAKKMSNSSLLFLSKIDALKKVVNLILPLVNRFSDDKQEGRVATFMLFSPLGGDFILTPALVRHFDQMLEHTQWAAGHINLLEDYHSHLNTDTSIFAQMRKFIPSHSKLTFQLILNELSEFTALLIAFKKEMNQLTPFSKDSAPEAAIRNYAQLLLKYRTRLQTIDMEQWWDSLEDVLVVAMQNVTRSSDDTSLSSFKEIVKVAITEELKPYEHYFSNIIIPINSSIFSWLKTASLIQEEKASKSPIFLPGHTERAIFHVKREKNAEEEQAVSSKTSSAPQSATRSEMRLLTLQDHGLVLERLCSILRTFQLGTPPAGKEQEYLLRKVQMGESLQNLEGFYLTSFKELIGDEQSKKTPYIYVETLLLRAALILEQTTKFLLAYYPIQDTQTNAHILFSWIDQKQVRSDHHLLRLLEFLQKGLFESKINIQLNETELESLGFFHNIIGASSRSVENSHTPEAALLRQLSLWSYLKHAQQNNQLSLEETEYLQVELGKEPQKWDEQIQREIDTLFHLAENHVRVALGILAKLMQAIAPKAVLDTRSNKEVSRSTISSPRLPTQTASSLALLLKEIEERHDQVSYLSNRSVNGTLEWNKTAFNLLTKQFRERQFTQALSEIPHYLIALNELLENPSAWMTYSAADALMLKTSLFLEKSMKALLSHFDIPSEQNPKIHLLLEVLENSSQVRLRVFDHDLQVLFNFLEKALKEKNIDAGFDEEMKTRLFTLRFFIGSLNRYPSSQKEKGKASELLEKLKMLSQLQMGLKDGFFTTEQYAELHKRGPSDQWPAIIEQEIQSVYDKEVYPLISSCLQATKKILEIVCLRLGSKQSKK